MELEELIRILRMKCSSLGQTTLMDKAVSDNLSLTYFLDSPEVIFNYKNSKGVQQHGTRRANSNSQSGVQQLGGNNSNGQQGK